MKIKNITIRNFLGYTDVSLQDLPDLVILVGKNSSGKSNFIDALALLFAEFGSDTERDLGAVNDYQHLFPNYDIMGAQSPWIEVSLVLSSEEWAKLLNANRKVSETFENSELRLVKRIVEVDGVLRWQTYRIAIGQNLLIQEGLLMSDFELLPLDSIDGNQVAIEDTHAYAFLSRLAEMLQADFRVLHTTEAFRHWDNRFDERPTIIAPEQIESLWALSQSKGIQRLLWTKVKRLFERVAPNEQRPDGVASSIQLEERELSVPIGMTGEGTQAILQLMDHIERGSSIIAIEEPETHLHPTLIKHVGQVLSETAARGKQLFVCTHSPFLIEQSRLHNFYIVKKRNGEAQISPMDNIKNLRDLLFDIGMRPSDILFSNGILLVEGLADELFYNHLSTIIDVPLAQRYFKLIHVGVYPRGRQKIEFWAEVGKDAGIPMYLILDKGAAEEAERAIGKGQIPHEHCLVLEKGDLEDYYPWEILSEVLAAQFAIALPGPIPVGERVKELRKAFASRGMKGNTWKPLLAEEVARVLTPEAAATTMSETIAFLRRIYYEIRY